MEVLKRYRTLIIVAALIALSFVGYSFLFGGGEDGNTLVSARPAATETAVERELLELLLDLRSVELDEEIFSDPGFQTLRDFGQTLTPEPVGRRNPFAPLGAGN